MPALRPRISHREADTKEIRQQVAFYLRNFPLAEAHPHAVEAAETAEFAGANGKFWEMHDLLFENQQAFSDRMFIELAHHLKLDVQALAKSIRSDEFAERVRVDFSGGVRSGVNGTPTFFINGQRHDADFDFDTLAGAINDALPLKSRAAEN